MKNATHCSWKNCSLYLHLVIYIYQYISDTFTSFVTKSAYKTNHNIICNSKCLIYLLSCKTCGKQYTGKTVDKFKSRWNHYKTDAGKQLVVT